MKLGKVEMAGATRDPQVQDRPRRRKEHGAVSGRPPHDVFVGYTTRAKPVADAIVSRFEQAGIRCWIAPRDVIPGMVRREAIVRAIESSRLMVAVLSGEADESSEVTREVERAFAKDVVVVPFRIESIEPRRALSSFVGSEHWLDAITPRLEAHIDELAEVAKALVRKRSAGIEEKEEVSAPPPSPRVAAPPPSPSATGRRRLLVPLVVAAGLMLGGAIAAVVLVLPDGGTEQAAQVEVAPPPGVPSEAPGETAPATPAGVGAPTELRAVNATAFEVKLIWQRPAGGAKVDHFRVFRDGDPVGKPLETRSFVDEEVEPGARHRYRVVAFGVDGSRASSKALAVEIPTPPPQAPSQPSQAPAQAPSQGSSEPPPRRQCDVVLDEGVCVSKGPAGQPS